MAILRYFFSLLLIGFVATALIRIAPGYGTDERDLDARFDQRRQSQEISIPAAYWHFVAGAIKGDLGFSATLNRPVRQLMEDRISTTARIAGAGWLTGWAAALLLAGSACLFSVDAFRFAGTVASGSLLCVPSALLAFAIAAAQVPVYLAVAAIVFARVFPIVANLFGTSQASYFVTAARCRGAFPSSVFFRHIVISTRAELVALAGASVAMAIGASVPVEVLGDQPGIGQLAWKAALGRDLHLLLSVTLLIAATTMFFNRGSDAIVAALRRRTG